MKRINITLLTVLAVASISTLVVWAGNGHFIDSFTTAACTPESSLRVTFKEAGLESGSVETIVLSGQGSATYQCFNNGGHNPKAGNKTTVEGPVSASGNFQAAKNGNIIGSLLLAPPSAGDFSCPSGQSLVGPTEVSFSGVTLTDTTSGATTDVGAAFSCP
jgi:hypothetical protein